MISSIIVSQQMIARREANQRLANEKLNAFALKNHSKKRKAPLARSTSYHEIMHLIITPQIDSEKNPLSASDPSSFPSVSRSESLDNVASELEEELPSPPADVKNLDTGPV